MPRESKINKNGDELSAGLMEDMFRQIERDKKRVVTIKHKPPPYLNESYEQTRKRLRDEWSDMVIHQIKFDREKQEEYERKMKSRTSFSGWSNEEITEYKWLWGID